MDVPAGKIGPVPSHLRDAHYGGSKKLGHGKGYQYSHDAAYGIAPGQAAVIYDGSRVVGSATISATERVAAPISGSAGEAR